MNEKKQISINMTFQILAFSLNVVINFFLTKYIVNQIGSEAFGFIGLANNFTQFIQLITVAINSMATRNITIKILQNNYKDANKYFSSVFFINIIISVVLSPIIIIFIIFLQHVINISANLVLDVKLIFTLIFINFFVSLITSIFNIATFTKNKLYLMSICNVISYLVKSVTLIIAYNTFKPHVWYVGIATLFSTLFIFIVNREFTKRLLPKMHIRRNDFDLRSISDLLISGTWNSVSKLSSILSSGLDLLIANLLIGSIYMGTVSLAKTIPDLILSFFVIISDVFTPQIIIYYAENKFTEIRNNVISSLKLLGAFASVIFPCFAVLANDFYKLWVPTQNAHILQVLSFVACIHLTICMPLQPLINVCIAFNKLKIPAFSVLISGIFTVLIELLLIPLNNNMLSKMLLIIISSTICELIRTTIFLPIYCSKILNLKYTVFYKQIFKNIFIVIIMYFLYYYLYRLFYITNWFQLLICGVILVIVGMLINYLFVLNKQERKQVNKMFYKHR